MKICLLSDTHGYLPEIEPCDLLIHAGDICPTVDHSNAFQLNWLTGNFRPWIESQPVGHAIVIAGNHDFIFEEDAKVFGYGQTYLKRSLGCEYLQDEAAEYEGYKIYGSPWQPEFCDWAFNLPRGELLAQKWAMIPDDVEILVTHGPPKNVRDAEGRKGEHVGCADLMARTWKLPELKLHVFGHIHHSYGSVEIAEAEYVNACYVDEGYNPRPDAPIYLTLPDK